MWRRSGFARHARPTGPRISSRGVLLAGDPVDADPTGMQTILDNTLTAWLTRLKQKAESSARDS